MTARRPRRRRNAPAASLPRPTTTDSQSESRSAAGPRRERQSVREHHVSRDFRYVRTDLAWVTAISIASIAVIVVAWLANPTW